jgi:hypothetical protein
MASGLLQPMQNRRSTRPVVRDKSHKVSRNSPGFESAKLPVTVNDLDLQSRPPWAHFRKIPVGFNMLLYFRF